MKCKDPLGEWYCFHGIHGLSCPAASDAEVQAAAEKLAAECFKDL